VQHISVIRVVHQDAIAHSDQHLGKERVRRMNEWNGATSTQAAEEHAAERSSESSHHKGTAVQ